jgi:hypothetical protein
MYNLFIFLTVLAIISQTIHSWFVFFSFSKLTGFLKHFQAVIFCSLISVAILAFVIIGNSKLALLGAFIEIVINCYYYALDYFENGVRAKIHRRESIQNFWRKNWVGFFFGLLIPMLIYVFALQLLKL